MSGKDSSGDRPGQGASDAARQPKRQPARSPAGIAEADARRRRLAEALRKNLRRRKAQQAGRGEDG